ncbi:hypothetical protein KFZ76_16660 [Methylovulum psychrotolerans]|nr:hypothetical protein [Methylovulum psychrotolerans]MBT9099328.1 hypothetical protein [Methylovulum psychrotolerans]
MKTDARVVLKSRISFLFDKTGTINSAFRGFFAFRRTIKNPQSLGLAGF